MTPELHAVLLGAATVVALFFSGLILARNPRSAPARLHAVYGGVVGWWFFCMAMLAGAGDAGEVELWGRLVHVAIGSLPAVMLHLNLVTLGVAHRHRTRIVRHYWLAGAVVLFGVFWPDLFGDPTKYQWGPYPVYTGWGLVTCTFFAVVFTQLLVFYRAALAELEPGTAYRNRTAAYLRGNLLAIIAAVDFLPAFGVGVYPFGFALLTVLHVTTVFGSVRYRLVEITPEFAAEQILETLPDGVLVVDSQGLVRLANLAAARMLDRELRGILDEPIGVVPSELAPLLGTPVTERPAVQEVDFRSAAGRSRSIALSEALLNDQRNEPVGRVWILRDLTEQRLAEARTEELELWARHGQKLETLGVMAGGIAHDFNNLLMAILGSAELAAAALDDTSAVQRHLERIMTAGDHASELTNQMLTYAGEASTAPSPIRFDELCTEIAELMKATLPKRTHLDFQFADDLPTVVADKVQMTQVILNLLQNAGEALEGGGGVITVRTGVVAGSGTDGRGPVPGSFVFVEITDTGVGIENEIKDRMFDPFFTTKFTGRGLGLATVAGIVRAHDGHIRVETEPGKGTSFTVALPAAGGASPAQPGASAGLPVWSGRGVALVVDDEEEVRQVAGAMLARAGFEVVEAGNGCQAVKLFRELSSDIEVVVLDVTMPEMDGIEVLAEIRTLSESVPIIMVSGYADEVTDPLTGEPLPLLSKPFRYGALAERLSQLVRY